MNKNNSSSRNLCDTIKCPNICIIGVSEGEKSEEEEENPYLGRNRNLGPRSAENPK